MIHVSIIGIWEVIWSRYNAFTIHQIMFVLGKVIGKSLNFIFDKVWDPCIGKWLKWMINNDDLELNNCVECMARSRHIGKWLKRMTLWILYNYTERMIKPLTNDKENDFWWFRNWNSCMVRPDALTRYLKVMSCADFSQNKNGCVARPFTLANIFHRYRLAKDKIGP